MASSLIINRLVIFTNHANQILHWVITISTICSPCLNYDTDLVNKEGINERHIRAGDWSGHLCVQKCFALLLWPDCEIIARSKMMWLEVSLLVPSSVYHSMRFISSSKKITFYQWRLHICKNSMTTNVWII